MSREEVASALDRAAEALAEAAHALRASDTPSREAASAVGAVPPPAPAARLPQRPPQNESGFTKCPAHAKEWKASKFPDGPGYCSAQSDDPEWSRNGYCSVTERSAAAWVRKHPPQPAGQAAPTDIDDVPF